jgi:glycerophosphoryl diester phosphodiesterase
VTLVAAHRGASSIAPENTLEAFEKAIEVGADMVEFDVRSTRDGVLVAFHDPVGEWTYAELCARLPFAPPRLEQVVETCAGRIALDVELKEPGAEDEVLRVVSGDDVVTSFLDDVVAAVKGLRPDVRTGLLLGQETPLDAGETERRRRACGADFLAPHVSLLDAGFAAGRGAVVWTVNDAPRLRRYLAEPSVAVVITDDPVLALAERATAPADTSR